MTRSWHSSGCKIVCAHRLLHGGTLSGQITHCPLVKYELRQAKNLYCHYVSHLLAIDLIRMYSPKHHWCGYNNPPGRGMGKIG